MSEDRSFWCTVALRASQLWDFIDERDIDQRLMVWAVFGVTCYLLNWTLTFVWLYPDKSGVELGLIIGAIGLIWSPVQTLVIKWWFELSQKKSTDSVLK